MILQEAPGHDAGRRSAATTIAALRRGLRRSTCAAPGDLFDEIDVWLLAPIVVPPWYS